MNTSLSMLSKFLLMRQRSKFYNAGLMSCAGRLAALMKSPGTALVSRTIYNRFMNMPRTRSRSASVSTPAAGWLSTAMTAMR